MSNLNGEGIITQVHKYVVKGQEKKVGRTRFLQNCLFEAQKLTRKKSVTIYSTPDENLNLPSILHVATKQSCINKNSKPQERLEEQMTLDL